MKRIVHVVILMTISACCFWAFNVFSSQEERVNVDFQRLKALGAEYAEDYPFFQEVKTQVEDAYEAHKKNMTCDEVVLGLEFKTRDENYPELIMSIIAVNSTDNFSFTRMSTWYKSVIIGAEKFLKLASRDKELLTAIQEKDLGEIEKIADTYSYRMCRPKELLQIIGPFVQSAK